MALTIMASAGSFATISTLLGSPVLGAFLIMVVYGVMALGAFSGLSDHPNKVGLVISCLLGIGVAVGAIFGAIYKVAPPFDRVWLWAVAWAGVGLLVTLAVKGREPARRALADLSTGEEG